MTCARCGHNRSVHRYEPSLRGGWDTSCKHEEYQGAERVKCSCPEYTESTTDSRLKRLLACLDDIRTAARDAETAEVRRLADELPTSDPRVVLLRVAAQFCGTAAAGANLLLAQLDSGESGYGVSVFDVHFVDGEWWVQSRETGWQWGGFPSEQCAQELADRLADIEAMLKRLRR